jgi:two-component system response regulator YesN
MAIDYINNHLSDDINIEIMGKVINLTPNYFSTLFKEEAGISFNSFIKTARLKLASHLLSHTELSVAETAERTGFHDSSYFSQVFKRTYGASPTEYRKNFIYKEGTGNAGQEDQ